MGEKYNGFKFEIGDHLVMRCPGEMRKRMLLLCVERIYQECPGGIQLHYVCRTVADDGCPSRECNRFNEVELEKWYPKNADIESSSREALKKALGMLDEIEDDILNS